MIDLFERFDSSLYGHATSNTLTHGHATLTLVMYSSSNETYVFAKALAYRAEGRKEMACASFRQFKVNRLQRNQSYSVCRGGAYRRWRVRRFDNSRFIILQLTLLTFFCSVVLLFCILFPSLPLFLSPLLLLSFSGCKRNWRRGETTTKH